MGCGSFDCKSGCAKVVFEGGVADGEGVSSSDGVGQSQSLVWDVAAFNCPFQVRWGLEQGITEGGVWWGLGWRLWGVAD